MTWLRLALIAAVVAALVAAGAAVRSHFVSQGDVQGAARVQSRWDAQKLVDQAEGLRLQQEADAEQLRKFRNSERNAYEQAQRDAATARRSAAATAAVVSLRSTIDTLNQRDLSAASGDASAAALAGHAATARELLGSCSEKHRELATAADGLRDQVTGLLDDATHVCRTQLNKGNQP